MFDSINFHDQSTTVVLNLDSIEPQGFGESVSGVRWLVHPTGMIRDVTDCLASLCTDTLYIAALKCF